MGWFKKAGKGISKGVQKIFRPKRPKPPDTGPKLPGVKPMPDAMDLMGNVADTLKDAVEDTGDALVDTGKKVAKVAKPVTDTVGKVLDPVVDVIEEVEHFAKTGDLGHQVVKLQEEEDEAKVALKEAQQAYLQAGGKVITAFARLRGLSVAYEDHDGPAIETPDDVTIDEVEVDLYGNNLTRLLDKNGLGAVGDGIRTLRKFTYMMPQEIVFKQIELAKHRKALRANIRDLKEATNSVKKSTKGLGHLLSDIEGEIAGLERKMAEAGIEAGAAAGTEMRALEVENAAKLEIARVMLEDGLPEEIVAELTGVSVQDLQALRGEDAQNV